MDRNENEKRVWVFDPANNRDHDAGNLRGKPIQAPVWAVNAAPGWAEPGTGGDEPRIILFVYRPFGNRSHLARNLVTTAART